MRDVNHLLLLVKKNIKLLVRSKGSLLIVILAPLLLILLIGLSYDTNSNYGLVLGVLSSWSSSESTIFKDAIEDIGYKVLLYNDMSECESDLIDGYTHACVNVPDDLTVKTNEIKSVEIIIDASRTNLAGEVQAVLDDQFQVRTQQLSEDLVHVLLDRIIETSNILQDINEDLTGQLELIDLAKSRSSSLNDQLTAVPNFTMDLGINSDSATRIFEDYVEQIESIEQDFDRVQSLLGSMDPALADRVTQLSGSITELKDEIDSTSSSSLNGIVQGVYASEQSLDILQNDLEQYMNTLNFMEDDADSISNLLYDLDSKLSTSQKQTNILVRESKTLNVDNASIITDPVTVDVVPVAGGTRLQYVFPALISMITLFLSLMLSITLVMMEKTNTASVRNRIVPVKKKLFLISNIISTMILVMFQVTIMMLISTAFLDIPLTSLAAIFVTLLLSCIVFSIIGVGIANIFLMHETAILAGISTGSLFLFLSNVFVPVEGMSLFIRDVVAFNPFVVSERVIRELFIFKQGIMSQTEDLLILIFYAVLLFTLSLLLETANLRHKFFKVAGIRKNNGAHHRVDRGTRGGKNHRGKSPAAERLPRKK